MAIFLLSIGVLWAFAAVAALTLCVGARRLDREAAGVSHGRAERFAR